jgi:hypothetical protein
MLLFYSIKSSNLATFIKKVFTRTCYWGPIFVQEVIYNSCYMCWSPRAVVDTWNQFPNIGFLAKQIFKILVSHIETKCVFNLVGVSTTSRRCKLHVKNLNHISTMTKNWYNDPCSNCLQHKNLINIMKVEHLLVEENYDLIEESNYWGIKLFWTIGAKQWLGLTRWNHKYFYWFFICFKIDRISNLNDKLYLKEFSPCVHVGFTCGTHYFIHHMKKLKMYICVIINTLLINLYAYIFVRFFKENIPYW